MSVFKHRLRHRHHGDDGNNDHHHDEGRVLESGPVTQVEGLMEFSVEYTPQNTYKDAKVKITEAGRSVEAGAVGFTAQEGFLKSQRICAVCPFPYGFAGSQGAEGLFEAVIPRKAYLYRKLGLYANHFNSHLLHVLALVLPKLAGVSSVQDVAKAFPKEAGRILNLYLLGNNMAKLAMGRDIHAISLILGGISHAPPKSELRKIRQRFLDANGEYKFLAELYASLAKDALEDYHLEEREFVALKSRDGDYPLFEGDVHTSKCDFLTPEQFARNYISEFYKDYSNSKFVKTINSPFFTVGALARLNLNGHLLCPESIELMQILGITLPCFDMMKNSAAQIVELPHICKVIIEILDELLEMPKDSPLVVPVKEIPGYGVGVLEAPRGIIINEYYYHERNGKVLIKKANYIIPTGMNAGSMEADIKKIAKQLVNSGASDEVVLRVCDMLLTQYDPCNSCAVHLKKLGRIIASINMCHY